MSLEHIDLDQIQDVEQAKQAIVRLFNLVEDLQTTVRQLQAENQRLRDENQRLKGEQGKPHIKPNKHGKGLSQSRDHSAEAERRQPQVWQKGRKLDKVKIDREAVLTIAPAKLPADAEFKSYEDMVVQDVVTPALRLPVGASVRPSKPTRLLFFVLLLIILTVSVANATWGICAHCGDPLPDWRPPSSGSPRPTDCWSSWYYATYGTDLP